MNRRQFVETVAAASALRGTAQGAPRASGGVPTAGFAERDITPEIGMEQPGGYSKVFHRAIHDACKVRAAVFHDGTGRVALVGVDALILPRALVLAARRQIQERCGIPPEAVMVGASHSHSSGPTGMVQPGEYDHASPLVRQLAYEKSSAAHPAYLKLVENEIVEAVCQADSSRAALRTGFGRGIENRVAYNRRFRMKNGQSWTHPGKGNPEIVEVAGPTDPDVTVIGSWSADGRLRGCVVHYCCHATTSPGGISANWIYDLERTIRGAVDPQAVVVFLQGFCGDVTQVDNLDPHTNPGAEQWCRLVGGRVGAEAVKLLLSMYPAEAAPPLGVRQKVLRIPRRKPSPAKVRRALDIVRQDPREAGVTEWTFAKETAMLDALIAKEPVVDAEVQAIQVGPAVFVAAPGEMFCQLGLDIKAGSPFKLTCPVELANGCVGYVPTEEALGPHGGGYETRLTAYTNLVPDAGNQMVRAGVELARQLTPARIPEPPMAPPYKVPWNYGNVPPELE
ncbi:MAG TPA: hypothetical protein VN442_14175 [Bryobacteraceae bacterium]|nr:hypothetical protein [Bryobacteraceae bacterium]